MNQSTRAARFLLEVAEVSVASAVIGAIVGIGQCVISTIWVSPDWRAIAIGVAISEGSIVGAMFAVPTGWFCYYAILNRVAPRKLWYQIAGVMLAIGIALGTLVGVSNPEAAFVSALAMPPITALVTGLFRYRQKGPA